MATIMADPAASRRDTFPLDAAATQRGAALHLTYGKDHPIFSPASDFRDVPVEAKIALGAVSKVRVYGNNEFIYLQDDDAENLYFVRSGHVRLSCLMEDGSAVLFGFLPPGEVFGELGVFEGGPNCDMATSVGSTSIFSVSNAAFRSLGAQYPALDAALARTLTRRYRAYLEITRSLRLKTLAARLAQSVLGLAAGLKTTYPLGDRRYPGIGSFVTQADLGLMARGARGNVNRHLKDWERAGLIAMVDRCILIRDREGLEAICLGDGE